MGRLAHDPPCSAGTTCDFQRSDRMTPQHPPRPPLMLGNMRGCVSAILVVLSVAASDAGERLTVNHGNIVLNGTVLTRSGQDSDPVMSPDGTMIVFNRRGPPSSSMTLCKDFVGDQLLELWMISRNGTSQKLLSAEGKNEAQSTVCAFDNKQFSSDGTRLYFETPAWVTSGATHVYEFRTKQERFVVSSNGLIVLSDCKDKQYRDYLVAYQHRYFVFGGSYDWAFLFTPQGKEIGPLGEDGLSAAKMWCTS